MTTADYAYDAYTLSVGQAGYVSGWGGGDIASSTGIMTASIAFNSTECADDETALYYYGYRFFSPGLGRWITRDPLVEMGWQEVRRAAVNSIIWQTRATLRWLIVEIAETLREYRVYAGDPSYRYDLERDLMDFLWDFERPPLELVHMIDVLNRFGYVLNDPVNHGDYLGLRDEEWLRPLAPEPNPHDDYKATIDEAKKSIGPFQRLFDAIKKKVNGAVEALGGCPNPPRKPGNP